MPRGNKEFRNFTFGRKPRGANGQPRYVSAAQSRNNHQLASTDRTPDNSTGGFVWNRPLAGKKLPITEHEETNDRQNDCSA